MKKIFFLIFLLAAVSLAAVTPSAAFTGSRLPTVIITRPPEAVVMPGTRYVYFLPDFEPDILFYHGNWYRPHSGNLFVSKGYNGPWKRVQKVPPPVRDLPPDFRNIDSNAERIPYRSLKKHWRAWEREGYWEDSARKARQKKANKKNEARKGPKPSERALKEPPEVRKETLKEAPEETPKGPSLEAPEKTPVESLPEAEPEAAPEAPPR